jgi:signal transduction histidine kinase
VIRGNGAELDISRAQAVAQAAELGRQRERVRHARLLHDRVLQTMETLSTGDWVTDIRVRRQIAGEAAWLRALVQGVPVEEPHELIPALHQVIGERSVAGPHVAFNTAGAEEDPLIAHVDPESVTALQDATREALANVAKHAGVDSAVVRVAVESGCVVVSVLDQGTGFDVHAAPQDRGLHRSIREPLASVGGRVVIDSERGAGTYVELVLPVRPRPEQPTDRI